MRQAVIVIGSSYGDEGKGMTAAFMHRQLGGRCLNILINGGAQRGHTVDLPDGRRYVFHHFGSACIYGAVSCFDRDFMVNPMTFEAERQALCSELPEARLDCMISADCRVTTVYDMALNQIIQDARGSSRHGSCGMGIYETRLRHERGYGLRWGSMSAMPQAEFLDWCHRLVSDYIPARLAELNLTLPPEWQEILTDEGMAIHFRRDVLSMRAHTQLYTDWSAMAAPWDTLIFEAGQGLCLDEDNTADAPHLTPSHTGAAISAARIASLPGETAALALYVTRSYLTRHGAGPLPGACAMEAINPDMMDLTNQPNPWQQTLRYGILDAEALRGRITADLTTARKALPGLSCGLMVTHLNETGGRLTGDISLPRLAEGFDQVWQSDSPWDAQAYR